MKRPPPDFWTFGMHGEKVSEKVTASLKVEKAISDGVEWARRILDENGIDPFLDSTDARRLANQKYREGEGGGTLQMALVTIMAAEDLRARFKSADAELPYLLMMFCAMAWSGQVWEFKRELLTGCYVHEGGAKGRAARPHKLSREEKAGIRQEMTTAKHGTKKAIKLALADKHRISVREIERIAAEE
jgi:hypothetical protein